MPPTQRSVDEIADDYIERSARLDPVDAALRGVAGHDPELTDYSPAGAAARDDLDRAVLAEIAQLAPVTERDRRAARVMRERLEARRAIHEMGEELRNLSTLSSPLHMVRETFDNMPRSSEEDWEVIAARLEQVPWSLRTARESLEAGLDAGMPAPQLLAFVVAEHARTWAGSTATEGFYARLAASADGVSDSLAARLSHAAHGATEACLQHAEYLRQDYAPRATSDIGAGSDRYAVMAKYWTGDQLDLAETYEWGWSELASILRRMRRLGERILPGAPLAEVVTHVRTDPRYVLESEEALRDWLQDLMDETIEALDGRHFDIPPEIRRVEAMIAPPGGAAAMYYTPPAEDFSRPGRTWYPTNGRTTFPLWLEKAICFHEGVPGHHLEVGGAVTRVETMTRFQRLHYTSGYSEGWALYAERLMGELGYLEDPVFELGMLATSAMRAARVVIDIGMHLSLRIPDDPGITADWLTPGAPMTPARALELAVSVAPFPRAFMESEIERYIGLPAQAISYKAGERVWLESREAARVRHGGAFDQRDFHSYALGLGSVGLAQLREELAAW